MDEHTSAARAGQISDDNDQPQHRNYVETPLSGNVFQPQAMAALTQQPRHCSDTAPDAETGTAREREQQHRNNASYSGN